VPKPKSQNNLHHNEQCWILFGQVDRKLWWGRKHRRSSGGPVQVAFDPKFVTEREELHGDVVGMIHTHPNMLAEPSARDVRTMQAWCDSLGKMLVCCIVGNGGTRAFWFDPDETEYTECQVKSFGGLLVGTTEDSLDLST
jgi:proteasome lid subunit RPN8/RPN11